MHRLSSNQAAITLAFLNQSWPEFEAYCEEHNESSVAVSRALVNLVLDEEAE